VRFPEVDKYVRYNRNVDRIYNYHCFWISFDWYIVMGYICDDCIEGMNDVGEEAFY
jgi:hypothetical protein